MVMPPTINSFPLTIIDANVLTALCAKEPNKYARAKMEVEQRALKGSLFYAPGVIVAETLFALCRQLAGWYPDADRTRASGTKLKYSHGRYSAAAPWRCNARSSALNRYAAVMDAAALLTVCILLCWKSWRNSVWRNCLPLMLL